MKVYCIASVSVTQAVSARFEVIGVRYGQIINQNSRIVVTQNHRRNYLMNI
jgi:hypothetical protein